MNITGASRQQAENDARIIRSSLIGGEEELKSGHLS
jgi:hypothetical protein